MCSQQDSIRDEIFSVKRKWCRSSFKSSLITDSHPENAESWEIKHRSRKLWDEKKDQDEKKYQRRREV